MPSPWLQDARAFGSEVRLLFVAFTKQLQRLAVFIHGVAGFRLEVLILASRFDSPVQLIRVHAHRSAAEAPVGEAGAACTYW